MNKLVDLRLTITSLCLSTFVLSCGGSRNDSSDVNEHKADQDQEELQVENASPFEKGITASIIFDADGDGDQDILLGGELNQASDMLLENNGLGKFSIKPDAIPAHYLGKGGATINFVTADFNADGNIDVLATTVDRREASYYQSARIHLYFGNGDGTFKDATSKISDNIDSQWIEWIRIGDIDLDGHMDFIITIPGCGYSTTGDDPGNCIGGSIYLNDGTGGFAKTSITSADSENPFVSGIYTFDKLVWSNGGGLRVALDLFVGDVNNDGALDIVASNGGAPGAIATFLNKSTPGDLKFEIVLSYQEEKDNPPYGTTQFKNGALLDINGDGLLDIIGSKSISGHYEETTPIYAFINQGDGLFVESNRCFANGQPGVIHARQWLTADFNSDGYTDLFVADHGLDVPPFLGHKNLLLISDGTGNLTDVTSSHLSESSVFTHGASVGDINGDGYPDLFLNNWEGLQDGAGEAQLWINNGEGLFQSVDSILQ